MMNKIKTEDFTIRHGSKMNNIKPILESWLSVCRKYRKQSGQVFEYKDWDHLYWYNELVNVSALSAAVWQVGGCSIAEIPIDKREGKEKEKHGRLDLYFIFKKQEFCIEAKHTKISLSKANKEKDWHNAFYQTRYEAIYDIVKTKKGFKKYTTKNAEYLAVSFFPFTVPNTWIRNLKKEIQDLLHDVQPNQIPDIEEKFYKNGKPYHAKCVASAWYFPKEESTTKDGFNDYCPGVVMVIDRVEN